MYLSGRATCLNAALNSREREHLDTDLLEKSRAAGSVLPSRMGAAGSRQPAEIHSLRRELEQLQGPAKRAEREYELHYELARDASRRGDHDLSNAHMNSVHQAHVELERIRDRHSTLNDRLLNVVRDDRYDGEQKLGWFAWFTGLLGNFLATQLFPFLVDCAKHLIGSLKNGLIRLLQAA